MQGLIIHSATGEVLSSDEINAAHRVANSFQGAKAGVFRQTDGLTGATVEYHAHKRMAMITPGTGFDYVKMMLPNPIPYRGVSIGVVDKGDGFGKATYVVASNGEVLAREAQLTDGADNVNYVPGAGKSQGVYGDYDTPPAWSGGGYVDMFKRSAYAIDTFDHKLNFEVPDDCLFEPLSSCPYESSWVLSGGVWEHGVGGVMKKRNTDVYVRNPGGTQIIYASNVTASWHPVIFPLGYQAEFGYWGLVINERQAGVYGFPPKDTNSQLAVDWAEAQASLKLRRKNWFKKNHDTVIAQIKTGALPLPDGWSYFVKAKAPVSDHTFRPILMNATYVDSSSTDSSGNLHYSRATTLSYDISVDGVMQRREEVFYGTKSLINTPATATYPGHRVKTFVNWWPASTERVSECWISARRKLIMRDKSEQDQGAGLFWNGSVTMTPTYADSENSRYGFPSFNVITLTYTPPLPPFSDTLSGTAPQFVLDYRRDVPIKYNKEGAGNTAWNDSALVDKTTITLIPFSPVKNGESLGMFWDSYSLDPDNTGIKSFDSLLIFGSAQYHYVYATVEIIFD